MSSRPTIICVDDERVVLDSLCEQLRRGLGGELSVEAAERGDEALEVFDELSADGVNVPMVISDHIMPGLSGADLLARVHQRNPKTRKVLLTGQAGADAVGRAVNEAALYRFIAKPWDQDDLLLTVREAAASYFQELKDSSDTLMKLVAGIVHEAATPLGAMCSAANTLKSAIARVPAASADARKLQRIVDGATRLSDDICNGGERITALIRNLEAFVHLDETDERRADVVLMVREAVDLVASAADDRISIACTLDEARAEVTCHPARLHRALINLLQNAAAAIDDTGEVRVEARVNAEARRVVVTIGDTGRGIPADQIDALFLPDFSPKTQKRMQLRMGLASCRNVVRSLRGSLQLSSEVGKGTTVKVTLPLA